MKKIISLVMFLILLSGVFAVDLKTENLETATPKDHENIIGQMGFLDRIWYYISTGDNTPLTVVDVGGSKYECEAYASKKYWVLPVDNKICWTNSFSISAMMQVYRMKADESGVERFLGEKQIDRDEYVCYENLVADQVHYVEFYLCETLVSETDTCFDSDGYDLYKLGTVTYNDEDFTDECIGSNEVKEYYCKNTETMSFEKDFCAVTFSCVDGYCVKDKVTPDPNPNPQPEEPEEEVTIGTKSYTTSSIIIALIIAFVALLIWKKLRRKR